MNAKGREANRYVAYQRPQGGSKKHALSLLKGSSSPVLSDAEGKAAVLLAASRRGKWLNLSRRGTPLCLTRKAYFQFVSTEYW